MRVPTFLSRTNGSCTLGLQIILLRLLHQLRPPFLELLVLKGGGKHEIAIEERG